MKRENDFASEMARLWREQGAMVYPLIANERTPASWPDKLVWTKLWQGMIELKGESTRFTSAQQSLHCRLNKIRQYSAFSVRDLGQDKLTDAYYCKVLYYTESGVYIVHEYIQRGYVLHWISQFRLISKGLDEQVKSESQEPITDE